MMFLVFTSTSGILYPINENTKLHSCLHLQAGNICHQFTNTSNRSFLMLTPAMGSPVAASLIVRLSGFALVQQLTRFYLLLHEIIINEVRCEICHLSVDGSSKKITDTYQDNEEHDF